MAAGWSIAEAIKTIVDRGLLGEWKEALKEREDLPEHSGIAILGGGDPDNPYIDRDEAIHRERLANAKERVAHTRRAVFDDLKELMRHAPLVARGHTGSVTGPPVQITESQWAALTEFNETASAVFGSDGSGFHGVTIYPILEAPGAAALIEPCSLASALDEYVLRDPEVSMQIDGAKGGLPANLRDVVGSLSDGRCLIHLTGDASVIKRDLNSFLEPTGNHWWHHNHTDRIDTLASRLAALGGILIRGELRAVGFANGDKEENSTDIGREDLLKPGTRLCLATGDIWREQEGEKQQLFHTVQLASPQGSAEASRKKTGGGIPGHDWNAVIPMTIANALLEGKIVTSHASLYREIANQFEALEKAVPSRDAIKQHMVRHHRRLLDAIRDANRAGGKPR